MTGFVTTQEAAERLNVTDARVRQLIADGILAAQKVGNAILVIPTSDVAKLKRQRQAQKRARQAKTR